MKIHTLIPVLVAKNILGNASPTEINQIEEWASLSTENRRFLNRLNDVNFIRPVFRRLHKLNMPELQEDLRRRLLEHTTNTVKVKRLRLIRLYKVASIIIIAVGIAYLYKSSFPPQVTPPHAIVHVDQNPNKQAPQNTDQQKIVPKPDHAQSPRINNTKTKALPNTQVLPTEESATQYVARSNGNVTIKTGPVQQNHAIETRTRVIRKEQLLPDGSLLTVNAASYVDYPNQFKGDKRKITLMGEAYIEALPDNFLPFFVTAGRASIETAGACFNIRSYDNEDESVITALTGGDLQVIAGPHRTIIHPGQQAVVKIGSAIAVSTIHTTDNVMAYTNLQFHFNNAPVDIAVREIARWYGLEVVGNPPEGVRLSFTGSRLPGAEAIIKNVVTSDNKLHLKLIGKQLILQ